MCTDKQGPYYRSKERFATLNVGNARNVIHKKLEYVPRIIRKVEELDESHVGIYVPPKKALITAYELAEQVRRADMYSGKGHDICST